MSAGGRNTPESDEITRVLQELRQRPELFNERLFPLLYDPMKRMARRHLQGESAARTFQPTVLVHEAYIRLVRGDTDWQNRAHFLACASNVMRQILVDYARKRVSKKRGGGLNYVPLEDRPAHSALSFEDVLAIDEALNRLRAFQPVKAELLKLKFFGGLTIPEAAGVLGIGLTAAKEHLRLAQAWMNRELSGGSKE